MTGLGKLGDLGDFSARSDAFAEALDGTAAGLLDDTEMLVTIVDRLHGMAGTAALAEARPRPEFRSQLRDRLLDEAHDLADGAAPRRVVPITSRWTQSWGRRNRTRLVSGVAAGVVGLTAASVAAANSLPGSPFYSLKRDSESLRYSLAGSDEARGKLELGFARTRLHEIDRLTAHDVAWGIAPVTTPQAAGATDTTILATSRNTRVVRLFADMDAEAAKGSALLARSFVDHPRPGPIVAVQQFAKYQEQAIASLTPRLTGPALNSAASSLVWAKSAVITAAKVLQQCGATTCTKASVASLTGPLTPTPGATGTPLAPSPSATASTTQTPSQDIRPLVPVPSSSGAASTSPDPTQGTQPTPGQSSGQPTPTDSGTQPTSPTNSPTTTPPTSPTNSPTPSPAPPTTTPPTTMPPTTTPQPPPTTTANPPTVPPPSEPVDTTPPPPPASTAPVPSTTPPPPSTAPPTTPPPPSASASATPAPTPTPTTTHGGPPPKPPICVPPFKLVGQVCIKPGHGPIHT